MKRYFVLQAKRVGRFLPGAILAALVLLGSLLAIFGLMVQQDNQSEENQKFSVALVGYTDDPFLQMGLSALTAFDSTRFSLNIQQMELESARNALARGKIAAYVEVPENFVSEAMYGNILPLKFVSTNGAAGLVSIFKDEITDVISQILLSAQKGIYGMGDAVRSNGLRLGNHMNEMGILYVTYVFNRDKTASVETLGIADALGLEGYLLCGLSVLFLMLCCLPFAPLMIQKDISLSRMLTAKGRPIFLQCLSDFAVYVLALLTLVVLLLSGAKCIAGEAFSFFSVFWAALPVVVMTAAFSYMLYSLSSDLIGGILLQFFTTLAVCFISGCLFPVFFFPEKVQLLAAWLPAGLARSQLAGCLTGISSWTTPLFLFMYSLVFFLVGSFVCVRRIKEVRA